MKIRAMLLITIFLILGVAVPAWGDLFTTTAAISSTQFTIEGASAPFNYGVSGQLISVSLDGEADLGVRLGVGISYGAMNGSEFTVFSPRVDWGFLILDYTFRISEGYQVYVFTENSATPVNYSYAGFNLGLKGQWKISEMLTVTAGAQIPQTGAFYRGSQLLASETPVAYSYNYGLRLTILPLISFTLGSSNTRIGDDVTPFRLENHGTSFGVLLRW